jgi:hypothetical protein
VDGTVSQLVTLASAVNGHLAGRFDVGRFFPDHADFKFCHSVTFIALKRGWLGRFKEVQVARDPKGWLQALKSRGARRAYLAHQPTEAPEAPDHILAAFVGGGGTWSLRVAYADRVDCWVARWQNTHAGAADRRIWSVTYGLVHTVSPPPASFPLPRAGLGAASRRLQSVLEEIEAFALRNQADAFARSFRAAGAMLNGAQPVTFPGYVDFVCLDCYPERAQRLFAAAYAAYVFGGMGSWNDLGYDDPAVHEQYVDLSARLYAAINAAIEEASKSFVSPT